MHFDILFVMRWWIAIGCVLAACSNDGALEIVVEIDPATSVDKVQLYVGLGDPLNEHDDMGEPQRELLVPEGYGYPSRPNGFYWKRDPNGASDVVDVDPGAADVRFTFHEGTHDTVTMIVVGYKADVIVAAASLVDARIEAGTVRQYHVKMKAASAAFPRPAASPVTVHRWGASSNDTQCAYLEDASTPERGIYVVGKDDKDCDGFPDEDPLECRDNVWRGRARPAPDQTKCLRTDLVATNVNPSVTACVLGGPGCVDGMEKATTQCEPSRVCAPPQHCAQCATDPNPIACMAELPAVAALVAQIDCTFFVSQTSSALCTGEANLTPRLTLPVGCDDKQPFQIWNGTAGWKPSTFTSPVGTFSALMPTSNCDFTVKAVNVVPNMTAGHESVVIYPLANGRYAALPLRISVKPSPAGGCDGITNECHVNGEVMAAPAFAACLTADVVEPW